MKTSIDSTSFSNPVSITVVIVLLAISAGLYMLRIIGVPVLVALIVISFLIGAAIKIADQWEKAVVLRMGKFNGLKGPGLFFIIPIIDQVTTYIDQRVRVTEFRAEQTLTKDTVPVNVDAVILICPASHKLCALGSGRPGIYTADRYFGAVGNNILF